MAFGKGEKNPNWGGGVNKGRPAWNKGKNISEETKNKISLFNKGKKMSEESKKKISLANRGRKRQPFSEEWRKKIGISNKGKHKYWSGKKMPPRTENYLNKFRGENSHFWKGGKSIKLYTNDWTNSLRIAIRERDKYTCRICGEKQGDYAFSVHHIDYNKENSNSNNLITLCKSCHSKTNLNRDYWVEYFKNNLG